MLTPKISASPDLSSLDALALHALVLADSEKPNLPPSPPTPHLQSVGSMSAIKCSNRECSNEARQLDKPRSIYCSRRCQSREQNLRQGRIRSVSAANSSIIHHRKLSQRQHQVIQTIDQDSELANKVTQFQRFQSLNNSSAIQSQNYITSDPGNIPPGQFHSPFPFDTFVWQSHFPSPSDPSSYRAIYNFFLSSAQPTPSSILPPFSHCNLPFIQLPVPNPPSHISSFSSPHECLYLSSIPSLVSDAVSISPLPLSHFDNSLSPLPPLRSLFEIN